MTRTTCFSEDIPARWPVFLLCLAAGLAAGAVISMLNILWAAIFFAALAGVGVIVAKPYIGILMVMVCTSFFSFYSKLPGVGIDSIHFADLLVGLLTGLFVLGYWAKRYPFTITPMTAAFFCFLGFSSFSMMGGVVFWNINVFEAFRDYKVVLYYGLFILVAGFCPDFDALRKLLIGCLAIGFVASGVVLVNTIVHPPSLAAAAEDVYYANTALAGSGGGILIYWCLCCSMALLVVDRLRGITLAASGMYLLYFILKFHRHMYMAVILAAVAIAVLAFRYVRKTLVRTVVLFLSGLIMAATLLAWGPSSILRYADLSVKRVQSLQTIKSTRTVSLRLLENRYAIAKSRNYPLFGIGFANSYRPPIYGPEDNLNSFVHNGYLSIIVKTGLLGFGAFLWLSILFVRKGLRLWDRVDDVFLKGMLLGSTVSYLGMAFASMTSPYFFADWGVAVFGLMFALTEFVSAKESRLS